MRVVFLEDVSGVARGGDVKEVRNGFARNYLIPKNLAEPATHNALQRVNRLRKKADETRVKELADLRVLAEAVDGVQVNIEMRAGTGGRLYGSVTNAIVAEELSRVTGREIDRRLVQIGEPIRQLGTSAIKIMLHSEVEAQVKVLVYATGTDPTAEDEPADGDQVAESEEEAVAADALGAEVEIAPEDGPAEGSAPSSKGPAAETEETAEEA